MKVFLDANVLYPQTLRDFILQFAKSGLINVYWSQQVLDEWYFSIIKKLTPKEKLRLQQTLDQINIDFPEAMVRDYPGLDRLLIFDKNDEHIIEAAAFIHADVILTFNTRDLPKSVLRKYGMTHFHPDKFVQHLLTINKDGVLKSLDDMMHSSMYDQKNSLDVIKMIANRGLVKSMRQLISLKNTSIPK